MGLPSTSVPIPGSTRPAAPTRPSGVMPTLGPARPAAHVPPVTPSGPGAGPSFGPTPAYVAPAMRPISSAYIPPAASAAVGASVDQKMAAFAAKGPEYEAIAKLSREIIEQIVWEIVPELAEAIIREHMEKRDRS